MKNSIPELNRNQLLDSIKSYKKLDYLELALEEFEMKDYFLKLDLETSRIKFRVRSQTVSTCSTHYSNEYTNIKSMFECREGCGSVDSIFHWNNSLCYAHLKSTNMTGSDEELCKFYSRVIKFRVQN